MSFCVVMAFVSYDISRRTTFPGSRPQLKERIENKYLKDDSTVTRTDHSVERVKN